MASQQDALDTYIVFYEQMTRKDLARLPAFFAKQAHFKDPFNDVVGVERINTLFHHMFDTLASPKFIIEEAIPSGDVAYIKWQFTAKLKAKSLKLVGVSRVVFDSDGLVTEHIDYWDASEQFYMKLPVIGSLLRFIRRQASS
jgi:steroid Delta-isomerase